MIHRFRVQNFKSLIDVSVDLEPVTVLVGRSGTGKSNFVEAIRTLRDILSKEQGTQNIQQAWPIYRPATKPEGRTRFEVDFSIKGIGEKFSYQLTISQHGPFGPPEEERLCLGEAVLFHQADSAWITEPELLQVQVPHPNQIALGRIPSISEIVVAYTALTTGVGCYIFPNNVLSGGNVFPHMIHSPSGWNKSSLGLDDQATNYIDAIKSIASNLEDLRVRKNIVDILQRVNSSVSSIELDDIQHPTHVVVGHKFNSKTLALQLGQESDGFRRFYAHLLALYQRPPKQTLLFEHPEDGIHPGALALLAEEFKAAPKDRRGQVILTTHSPKLLDHFDPAQIRVVELQSYETSIGPISQEQREAIQDDLLDAGELLTVDPARLDEPVSESAGA